MPAFFLMSVGQLLDMLILLYHICLPPFPVLLSKWILSILTYLLLTWIMPPFFSHAYTLILLMMFFLIPPFFSLLCLFNLLSLQTWCRSAFFLIHRCSAMTNCLHLLLLTFTLLIKLFMHWICTFIKPRALDCSSMLHT